jgi:putative peptidoglycan lipid II flippase
VVGKEVPATADVLTPGSAPEPDAPESFVRHTAVMSVGTAFSRLTGYLRLSAMAYALGIGIARADAYNVANNTPNIVYELVLGGVLTSVFVPVFVEWMTKRSRDEAWDVARAMFSVVLVALTGVMVVTIVAAPWVVRLYTLRLHGPGAESERQLATFFLRWFMPQIVFYGLGAVATGFLNAHRRFAVPMFAPILNNLIVIATMITFAALPGPTGASADGVTTLQRFVLAIGTTAGVAGMTIALWPSVRATGFRFRWRPAWREEAVRRIGRLALWVFLYVLTNQVGLLVVIVLAASVKGYTAYIAAFTLFQLPHAVYAVSVMTALLPSMSRKWSAGDRRAFRDLLGLGLRSTAFIVVPAALGYIALAGPIAYVTLRHGATKAAQAYDVARVLVAFVAGLPFFSAFQLLLRAFYGMQDTRTPAVINVIATGVAVVLDFVLFPVMGVPGLALAFAVSYVVASTMGYIAVRARLRGMDDAGLLRAVVRTLVAATVASSAAFAAAAVIRALTTTGFGSELAQVVAGVAAGGGAYMLLASAMHIEEVAILKRFLPARHG